MRPVTDLQRRVAPFEVVTDMVPAGDQPQAIAEMEQRIRAGRRGHRAARRDRDRQDRDRCLAGGAAAAAGPGHAAEQDPGRPVRQRAARDAAAATRSSTSSRTTTTTSPRRTSRRPTPTSRRTPRSTTRWSGCGTRRPTRCSPAGTRSSSRRSPASTASARPQEYVDRMLKLRKSASTIDRDALLRQLVGMQYARNDLSFTRGTFRVRGDTIEVIPVVRGAGRPDRDVRRRGRAADDAAPADRRGDQRGRRAVHLPGLALRGRAGADGAGDRRHRGRAGASGWPSWSGRASCSRRSGCGCAPPTTSR